MLGLLIPMDSRACGSGGSTDLDDDFAEGAALQVVERSGEIGKVVALVDHRLEADTIHRAHEIFESPPMLDSDPLQRPSNSPARPTRTIWPNEPPRRPTF